MLRTCALVLALAFLACASKPGPSRQETQVTEFQARVEAVDQKTRRVTLVDADGTRATFRADDAVVNLPQVKVGDTVVGQVMQSFAVEVRPATAAEKAAPNSVAEMATAAEPGEKPAGLYVRQAKALFTIASIDKAKGGGELKDSEGKLHFVKVRDPKVLDRVKVGETVVVTVTDAVRIEVVAP
jgi:hypothetical protein